MSKIKLLVAALCIAVIFGLIARSSAFAAEATGTFTARIVIEADCQVLSPTTLDFGTRGALSANVDATSTFQVQCTNLTPYTIRLNQGTGIGASIATRRMTGSGGTIDYRMFSDGARTVNWGETDGADTIGGTGDGTAQAYTIFGRVPAQTTPAADTYLDTVTITVFF